LPLIRLDGGLIYIDQLGDDSQPTAKVDMTLGNLLSQLCAIFYKVGFRILSNSIYSDPSIFILSDRIYPLEECCCVNSMQEDIWDNPIGILLMIRVGDQFWFNWIKSIWLEAVSSGSNSRH